ncbi:FAD-binding oxidoreductase [Candidatus Saccharibacteria bacterium]|nr:FAD-binding oxidoreductase [Candidatus Saccharibacteria bacterium]
MDLQAELSKIFQGDLDTTDELREFYSHDASLFELKPQVVGFPKSTQDVQNVVRFVTANKQAYPELSIVPRGRGTDMSGGAIGQSVVLDFSKYMKQLHEVTPESARVQPGMLFREFDVETLKQGSILPSYPASRDMASVGGMASNNSGGEKSLEYGKTDNFVSELSVVLSDGNEYVIRPINREELTAKMNQGDFEGNLYARTFELLDAHYDEIQAAKPKVSKDSTGYHLWNVWNRETGIFDLTKLFVGAQGTLGIITDIKFKLVPARKHSGLLVLFLKNSNDLGELIPKVLEHKPATFESFDDKTLWLSIRFMPSFLKMLGPVRFIHLLITLIPDGLQLLHGIPKLILLVEFNGETAEEVREKVKALHKDLKGQRARYEINGFEEAASEGKSEKFWILRRNSFQILRSKVKDKHTAPYIDSYFKDVKQLYDPQNIFNPHKKTDADWDFSYEHIRQSF